MHSNTFRSRFLLWTLILLMLLASTAQALPLTAGVSQRQSTGSAYGDNAVPYGKSPTTGLDWTGEYRPILVQISNSPEARPHWNMSEADIVYESILQGPRYTRYSLVFSDNYPEMVGAVRSAREHHMKIREEWDCPIVYWGGQTLSGTSIEDFLKSQNVPKELQINGVKGGAYTTKDGDGTLNRSTGQYARVSPHNAIVYLAQFMQKHYPNHTANSHAFKFTDTPADGYDSAVAIDVNYGIEYNPSYTYNEALQLYERSYNGEPQYDGYTGDRIVASNVIVQRATHTFYNNIASRPIIELLGEGDADIFVGGRHIQGKWIRKNYDDRTVFVDLTGVEIELLPGKTFIQIIPNTLDYTYTRADGSLITAVYDERKLSALETMELEVLDEDVIDEMGDE